MADRVIRSDVVIALTGISVYGYVPTGGGVMKEVGRVLAPPFPSPLPPTPVHCFPWPRLNFCRGCDEAGGSGVVS